MNTVLEKLDKNKDGKISMDEFLAVGLDGLPNFDDLGAEGHHYDVESGALQILRCRLIIDAVFTQSSSCITKVSNPSQYNRCTGYMRIIAEEFHSTPETQTDDSYTHPEDLEHFAQHEKIEREEAEREARFQGISVEEALKQHEPHPEDNKAQQPVQVPSNADSEAAAQDPALEDPALQPAKPGPVLPKFTRSKQEDDDPAVRYQNAKANGQWGEGDHGYAPPKLPSDRLKCVMVLPP